MTVGKVRIIIAIAIVAMWVSIIASISSCSSVVLQGKRAPVPSAYTEMMKRQPLKELEALNREVNNLQTYAEDNKTFGRSEHWMHHADAVDAGLPFVDDCDGSAWTKARLIQRRGILPPDKVAIVNVLSPNGEARKRGALADHQIVVVEVEGKQWILDNNYKWLRPAGVSGYDHYMYMRLSEEGVWRYAL